ncbi:MAG: hypothetical protein JWR44_2109 [Hymenobacter sp.]|jgi:hypothetical protein|nr:hypothetical protein [Hymenobacter sp.]
MRSSLLLTSASFFTCAFLLDTTAAHAQVAYAKSTAYTSPAPGSSSPRATAPDVATTTFTGRVVSPTGVLPGAVVKLVGTSQMAVTNSKGEFRLTIPAATNARLQLLTSYAGFADETVTFSPFEQGATVTLATPHVIKVARKQQLKAYMKTAHRQAKRSLRQL